MWIEIGVTDVREMRRQGIIQNYAMTLVKER